MTQQQNPYQTGDIVNGHQLTTDGQWVPLGPATATLPGTDPQQPAPLAQPPQQGMSRTKKILIGAGAALAAVVVLGAVTGGGEDVTEPGASGSGTAAESTDNAPPAAEASDDAGSFDGSGMYEVGADVQPGLYVSEGSGYWERLSGASGEFDEIIANGNGSGGVVYVEILPSDEYFSTSGFDEWVLVEDGAPGAQATSFSGDGMYRVGEDIQPGTYKATGNGYWERSSGATGEFDEIIANGNGNGSVIVAIESGDEFFYTSDFSDWTLVS